MPDSHRKPVRLGAGLMSDSPWGLFGMVLLLIFAVEAGLMLLLPHIHWLDDRPTMTVLLDAGLLVATLCPAMWLLVVRPVRELARERGRLLREQISVQESERARLAQELHDELGQIQTAILLTARAAAQATDGEQAREHAKAVHELATSAIASTRRLARGLSPAVLNDFGLEAAVKRLAEDLSSTGAVVLVRSGLGARRFPGEIELAALRVIQESVANAVKHAAPSEITVDLDAGGGYLEFAIRDDGSGFAEPGASGPGGLGLRGMRERLVILNGELAVRTSKGAGTTVTGRLPAEIAS